MDWVSLIQQVGFPIACVIACAAFIYTFVTRTQDEAKEREDKLIDANVKSAEALEKVSDTIAESNRVNSELSETNRLLVEKMEDKLTDIDQNVSKILDKMQ